MSWVIFVFLNIKASSPMETEFCFMSKLVRLTSLYKIKHHQPKMPSKQRHALKHMAAVTIYGATLLLHWLKVCCSIGCMEEHSHSTLRLQHSLNMLLKGSRYFRRTQNTDDGRKLTLKYYLLRCCSFWEMSNVCLSETKLIWACKRYVSVRRNLFEHVKGIYQFLVFIPKLINTFYMLIIFVTLFYSLLKKSTAPQQVIFKGKLSTNIIFKLCEFNRNLWTLCYQKYPNP